MIVIRVCTLRYITGFLAGVFVLMTSVGCQQNIDPGITSGNDGSKWSKPLVLESYRQSVSVSRPTPSQKAREEFLTKQLNGAPGTPPFSEVRYDALGHAEHYVFGDGRLDGHGSYYTYDVKKGQWVSRMIILRGRKVIFTKANPQ
ncbi:MAG: hypothetical protein QGG42_00115 [Phycisphaerae bacterium]|jgi:hypothetical protein|nr:hypothetical protein [Phycisphaerae bacterium]